MFFRCAIAITAALFAPTAAAASSLHPPINAQSVEQNIVGGAWTGKLLQKDWTVEFRNEDGRLHGRMLVSGGDKWYSLHGLAISGRSVSFALESKPKMSFSLEVGATDQDMSGTVTLDGFGQIPFSATRTP